jgi:protein ImuB
MFACIHSPGVSLVEWACDFSPRVEYTAAGTLVLDIDGLEPLFGSPQQLAEAMARRASRLGLTASIAVASNPDAAVLAALGFGGVTVIPPGTEAECLGRLPLEILPLSPEMGETLGRWGLRTFRDFAGLPETGIAERLGPEGVRLQRLARGSAERPLAPADPPPIFEETMELEDPVALLEPLSFILARLLNQLCGNLELRGLATNELRLTLRLEDRTQHARALRLPFPMRDSRTFLKLLQLDLDSHPPEAPVTAVSLSAQPVNPRVIQNGLFLPLAPEPQKLELTLARIANLVGENNVGWPELLDTHRPEAFRLSRDRHPSLSIAAGRQNLHLALRFFRPPLQAKVEAPCGRPTRILARGVRGTVRSVAGPWRSSGDWWTAQAWSRDDWDVALSDGALYRIYLDRHNGGWFVEGSYD